MVLMIEKNMIHKMKKPQYNFIDMTGQAFGRWTVISRAENIRNKSGKSRSEAGWLCKCECGNEKVISGKALRAGLSQSCGCLHKERNIEAHHKLTGENHWRYVKDRNFAGTTRMFTNYKSHAKERMLAFDLSFETFSTLIQSPCIYCGELPSNVHANREEKFVYGGIDRIDNSMGYINGNVVPCCRMCNISKNNHSQIEFLDWVERVFNHSIGCEHD